MTVTLEATLSSCDEEVIHCPGAVQLHGILLVLSEPDLRMRQISENALTYLNLVPAELLGQPLWHILNADGMAEIKAVLAEDLLEPRYLPSLIAIGDGRMEAVIHRVASFLILELEPAVLAPDPDVNGILRRMLTVLPAAPSLFAACHAAVRGIREITGFDRVMIYRFRADGAGSVVAEDRRADLLPFLGLHYPASDIPRPARLLFALNPLRIWVSTDSRTSPVIPELAPDGSRLDMSRCVLRAGSPVHLQYLRNMGVGASLALSIMRDGTLWGMIVCHHDTSRTVPHRQRDMLVAVSRLLALQLEVKEQQEQFAEQARLHAWIEQAVAALRIGGDLFLSLRALGHRLLEFVPAGGVAVHIGGRIHTAGSTPPAETVATLANFIAAEGSTDITVTASLPARFGGVPGLRQSGACGLLAVPVSGQAGDLIMWFRPEVTQSITWAGDPAKQAGPIFARQGPRACFTAWVETIRHQSEAWSPVQIQAASRFSRTLSTAPCPPAACPEPTAVKASHVLLVNDFARRLTNVLEEACLAPQHTRRITMALKRLAEGLRAN